MLTCAIARARARRVRTPVCRDRRAPRGRRILEAIGRAQGREGRSMRTRPCRQDRRDVGIKNDCGRAVRAGPGCVCESRMTTARATHAGWDVVCESRTMTASAMRARWVCVCESRTIEASAMRARDGCTCANQERLRPVLNVDTHNRPEQYQSLVAVESKMEVQTTLAKCSHKPARDIGHHSHLTRPCVQSRMRTCSSAGWLQNRCATYCAAHDVASTRRVRTTRASSR